jgi:hypothetical protein
MDTLLARHLIGPMVLGVWVSIFSLTPDSRFRSWVKRPAPCLRRQRFEISHFVDVMETAELPMTHLPSRTEAYILLKRLMTSRSF